MADSGEEKTEKPTPKKKKESRKEGQVARTQELGGWLSMLAVGLALPPLLGRELDALRTVMVSSLAAVEDPSLEVATRLLGEGARHVLVALVLLGCGVLLVGVAGTLAQGGFYLATKAVKPSAKKLNPISGFKRIFGTQALWEGAKTLLKSAVVGFLLYGAVKAMVPLVGGLVPIPVVLTAVADQALGLIRNIAVAGVVMAVADYAFQRRKVGKQTRMSHSEIKQEHKQAEGDPQLKGAIRSRQMAMSRSRMMAAVADADVVLVNPTHVAIALRYDAAQGAPRVVARGAGAVAAKIRERAAEHDVPLVRDVPLARALYGACEVGHEIPAELFAAVAQVLAFVISRRSAGRTGGEHRSPRPEGSLPPVATAGRRRRTGPVSTGPSVPSAAAAAGR